MPPGPEDDSTRWSKLLMKYMVLSMTSLFVVFLFFLPLWSWLLNDVIGLAKTLCKTPAEQLTCGNGESYESIAKRLNRRDPKDWALVGCGCEEGILRDWACALGEARFSISYFISTSPGTGIMAALSFWPVIGMWFHGAKRLCHLAREGTSSFHLNLMTRTLISFQFFYGFFLFNTTCVFPWLHVISVALFNISAVAHYLIVAYCMGQRTRSGRFIRYSCFVAIGAISFGFLYPVGPSWFGQHAFWLGECIGLTSGMCMAPLLIFFFDEEQLPISGSPRASQAELGDRLHVGAQGQ